MSLTTDEIAFLNKIEQDKIKHREASKRYRASNKEKIANYNKKYQQKLNERKAEINKKFIKRDEPIPEPIDIEEFSKVIKIDKRTRKGRKKATKEEIIPSFQTRKEPLDYSTMDDYLRKANILNKLFNGKALSQEVKAELKKLLNDNPNTNNQLILNEMSFIYNDIDNTINILRQSYTNNNSFKSYINVLAVISSHIEELKKIYAIYTKLGKDINKQVQEVRELNELKEEDEGKIIPVGEEEFKNNIDKLETIDDILIYALYLLFPARRADYRNMLITSETDIKKLNGINFLIRDGNKKKFVFNDYKTFKKYKKQVFDVPESLNKVINKYLSIKGLKDGDYLISLERSKKEILSEGNFSTKVSNVFNKIYNIPISIRFLRMSWASSLYSKNPTAKEIKEIAYKMSHAPQESLLYKKLLK
jgi:hypothetical protein